MPTLTPIRSGALVALVFGASVACGRPPDGSSPGGCAPNPPAERMADSLELRSSTDRDAYAPGDPVELTLILANRGAEAVTLEFSDAQRFDFRILVDDGEPVWRWSDDHAFAQVLGEERLAPGDSLTWSASHEGPLPEGDYLAEGVVPALNRTLRAEASFRVR